MLLSELAVRGAVTLSDVQEHQRGTGRTADRGQTRLSYSVI